MGHESPLNRRRRPCLYRRQREFEAVVIDEYLEPDGVLAEGEVAPSAPRGLVRGDDDPS